MLAPREVGTVRPTRGAARGSSSLSSRRSTGGQLPAANRTARCAGQPPQLDAVQEHERGGLALGLLIIVADQVDTSKHMPVRIDLERAVVLDAPHRHPPRLWYTGSLSQSVRFEVTSFCLAR